jgi:hypothetical protein
MAHDATEHHTRVMYDFLVKEGTKTETDEDKSTVGVNPNQQPDPEGRAEDAGTIDAPWGEKNDKGSEPSSEHFSDAVAQGFIQSRQNILDELFDGKKPAAKAEQKLVSQNFDHARSGDYESKAPLLESKTAGDRTLRELTQGILED